ncbi:MAG: DinB family protein [Acidobacteria bacterium]|nr:DinB family protein [Acidobacteriota bacterium]
MSTLYQMEDRNLRIGLLSGEGGFHSPVVVLDGLSAEQAMAKPHGLPHSLAEIVAHMCFWQEWFNDCARSGFAGMAEHAAEGWPEVAADGWDDLRGRYLAAIEEAKRIVATSDSLGEALLPPGVPLEILAKESRGSGLLHAVVHNGHHLGQIVTMRQLLGLWPPAAGSMTW